MGYLEHMPCTIKLTFSRGSSKRVIFLNYFKMIENSTNQNCYQGRDPLSQNFWKFQYKIKWNGIFRKLCFENSGQPLEVVLFSENLEIPEIFCSIWHSIIKSICPTAHAGSWLAILHKNANICFLVATNGRPCGFPTGMRPVWITPWQRTCMREVCTFPFSSEDDF